MGRRTKLCFSPPKQDRAKCASRIPRRFPNFGAVAPTRMGLLNGEDFAGGLVLADEADFGLVVADRHLEDATPEVKSE